MNCLKAEINCLRAEELKLTKIDEVHVHLGDIFVLQQEHGLYFIF